MTRLLMRWECAGPSLAWCCCARGTNCGKRWKAMRRWRQEGLHERIRGRKVEASGRDDLPAVPRAPARPRARAGSFRPHERVRYLRHAAARAGARVAPADARDAGRHGTAAVAACPVPGKSASLDAMDLGPGVWTGGNRRVRALHGIHRALAAAAG